MTTGAIVFDLDDTLYPRRTWVMSGFDAVARHLALTSGLPCERVRRTLREAHANGQRGLELQVLCARFALDTSRVPELIDVMRWHQPEIRLAPNVATMLAGLRPSWRLGILTNGDPFVQARKIRALGLAGMVDAVVYAQACGIGIGKPDPAAFRAITRRLTTTARATVFVGDDWNADILGAASIGMKTIHVTRRPGGQTGAVHADAVVRSVRDVPSVVGALVAREAPDRVRETA